MNKFMAAFKSEKGMLLSLLALGLVLRLAYAWLARGVLPWNDMAAFDGARLGILNHQPYTIDWPPLYPLVLAAVSCV